MAKKKVLRGKKGQVALAEAGEEKRRTLLNYFFSILTGAKSVEAPISLRYLLVGDTGVVGRIRRDAQWEKTVRHRMENDLHGFIQTVELIKKAKEDQKEALSETAITQTRSFVMDYKKDLSFLVDICKQDATLLAELMNYDKVLIRFLEEIEKQGFPAEQLNELRSQLGKTSQEFHDGIKRILTTAQSEYRDTASIGKFSIKTSDTMDRVIRRVGRLINNYHLQILEQMKDLKDAETKADIAETMTHAGTLVMLMHAELDLMKMVIEDDQVLIHRLTTSAAQFKQHAENAQRYLAPSHRQLLTRWTAELTQSQAKQLLALRQVAQQMLFQQEQLLKV